MPDVNLWLLHNVYIRVYMHLHTQQQLHMHKPHTRR